MSRSSHRPNGIACGDFENLICIECRHPGLLSEPDDDAFHLHSPGTFDENHVSGFEPTVEEEANGFHSGGLRQLVRVESARHGTGDHIRGMRAEGDEAVDAVFSDGSSQFVVEALRVGTEFEHVTCHEDAFS